MRSIPVAKLLVGLISILAHHPALTAGQLRLDMNNGIVREFPNVYLQKVGQDSAKGSIAYLSLAPDSKAWPVEIGRIQRLDTTTDSLTRIFQLLVRNGDGSQKLFEGVKLLGYVGGAFYAVPKGYTQAYPLPAPTVLDAQPAESNPFFAPDPWKSQLTAQAFLSNREKPVTAWTSKDIDMSRKLETKFMTSDSGKHSHDSVNLLGQSLKQTKFVGPTGDLLDVSDFRGKKKVMLVIMRGFSGYVCIGCSTQLAALSKAQQEFEKRNTQVVIVYPGQASTVPTFLEAVRNLQSSGNIPFPVLYDVDLKVVAQLGIQASLAKPTSLLLDEQGIVRYAYVGTNAADRPSVKSLLETIDGMGR